MRHVPGTFVVLFACLGGLFAPACGGGGGSDRPAPPVLYVLDLADNLYTTSVSDPTTLSGPIPIGPLGAGERVVGIDVRPLTGALYGLAVDGNGAGTNARLLLIDTSTGLATPVGGPFALTAGDAGVRYGFDFNPTVDRIRVVNAADVNFRIDPGTGIPTPPDTALNPAGQLIGALAYDRNVPGGAPGATTAYVLNMSTGMLQTLGGVNSVPSPNGGTLSNVGPLGVGVNPGPAASFDVAPDGDALALIDTDPTVNTASVLFRINLATGAATPIGPVGPGIVPFRGLAIR